MFLSNPLYQLVAGGLAAVVLLLFVTLRTLLHTLKRSGARTHRASATGFHPYVVRSIKIEARDIKSFQLFPAKGGVLGDITPGSHINVMIAGVARQYSLCNGPHDKDHYLIAVRRHRRSRGGSKAMHRRVREGDTLFVSGPANHFPLVQSAAHHLLVAGGIGITPLLSMARHLLAQSASFQLQYFSRSVGDAAFHDLLLNGEMSEHVVFHYAVEPDRLAPYLHELLSMQPDNTHIYVCGPRPFMDAVEAAAAAWPIGVVHREYFVADPTAGAGPRYEFEVVLGRSGRAISVPADKSIVESLADHGVYVPTSCSQGVCGTCLVGVLGGEPDHRDVFLTDREKEAGDKIIPCVSRAKGERLVLDL